MEMIPSISVDMLRSREYKIPPRILLIGLLRARHMDAMTCSVLVKFKHGSSSKAAFFSSRNPSMAELDMIESHRKENSSFKSQPIDEITWMGLSRTLIAHTVFRGTPTQLQELIHSPSRFKRQQYAKFGTHLCRGCLHCEHCKRSHC